MFSAKAHLSVDRAAGADRLNREAMAQHSVVAHLVELAVRKLQPRGAAQVHGLSAADPYIEPLVAALHERSELVDREEVFDSVTNLLGHVTRIVCKRLCRLLRLP